MNKREIALIEKRYEKEIQQSRWELEEERFLEKNGYPKSWSLLEIRDNQHNYPKFFYERKNNVVKVRAQYIAPKSSKNSLRGEVSEFSRKSRKRLLEFLWSIDWSQYKDEQVREITLTYHNSYPDNGKDVKQHLHNFRRHIMKSYPGSILIWKLEYQKRGAPHFHIILISKRFIILGDYLVIKESEVSYYDRNKKIILEEGADGLRAFVQRKWSQVTGESVENFNSGVEVEIVRKKDRMAFYLCKYMAKEGKYFDVVKDHKVPEWFKEVGRWWGCYGRKELKIKIEKREITEKQYNSMVVGVKQYWKDNELPDYVIRECGPTLYAKDEDAVVKYVLVPMLEDDEKDAW